MCIRDRLNLARGLAEMGVPILGTSWDAIDLAEDRGRFGNLLAELDIPMPANGMAVSVAEARRVARQIGYPVLVRPSYVLGGRAMAVSYTPLRAHETVLDLVCRLLLEKTKIKPLSLLLLPLCHIANTILQPAIHMSHHTL